MATKPQILYNNLVKYGWNVGTYNDFSDKIKDYGNRRALFQNLQKDGWDTKDYNTFSNNLGYSPNNFWDKKMNPIFGKGDKQTTNTNSSIDGAINEDVDGVGNFFKNIYNSLIKGTTSTLAGAANILAIPAEISPIPGQQIVGLNDLGSVQDKILNEEQKVDKSLTTSNSDALSKKYSFDIHHKSLGENIGSVVAGIAGMVPQIAGASFTGGATYFMSGYDDGLKDAKSKGMGENATQAYALLTGGINKLMMDLPIAHALDETILKKFVTNYSTKLLADAIEKMGARNWTKRQWKKFWTKLKWE